MGDVISNSLNAGGSVAQVNKNSEGTNNNRLSGAMQGLG